MWPVIGSEEIAAGRMTRAKLRWSHRALYPDVHLPKDAQRTLDVEARGAWLWTKRTGVVAGLAAARLHGVYRVPNGIPVEVIGTSRRPPPGVVVRNERICADEIARIGALPVTSPARTALDLARRLPREEAVAYLDSLATATGVTAEQVAALAARYRSARGIKAARDAIDVMDGGARSPEETALRLLLVDAILPRPRTAIRLEDARWSTVLAMGWDWAKVAVDWQPDVRAEGYCAVQHIATRELIGRMGWLQVLVHPLHTKSSVLFRVRTALEQRGRR